MKVAVVGTGYVGLGTAALLAYFGHQVMGLDIDQGKVEMLVRGELPIYEPGLGELMAECGDRLQWTTDYSAIQIPPELRLVNRQFAAHQHFHLALIDVPDP